MEAIAIENRRPKCLEAACMRIQGQTFTVEKKKNLFTMSQISLFLGPLFY